ncbi:MAG: HflC protein [Spirochaetes bacterium GWD1_27_9]|nr:MAG: HflC protein [Spirochaetes bacterium GWB1_27_13]OHD23596.1 MAG: HflC protein [Spirochaetes bacterium GWC1_27_15]OHD39516.1 MAG: HflC protein [Spirochaetes bacterium GWD1_27_9]
MTNTNMNKTIVFIAAIVGVMITIVILGPWYSLQETQTAILTRFGKPIRAVTEAGIHWKIPFIDSPNYLPKQILEWDGEARQFPTYDKRMILVYTTVKWKIKDPLKFFISLSDESNAKVRLDDILDATSRKVISQHSFEEIVRDSNRIKQLNTDAINLLKELGITQEELDSYPKINFGRSYMGEEMKREVAETLNTMGIEVDAFYIQKVNYISDNLKSVYESMIAERKKIAQSYRSQGERYRQEKLGEMEQKAKEILAEAKEQSKSIMGQADAIAAATYIEAYNKNASTRDFYQFMKKMEAYKKTPTNTSLVISTDSDFYDMLKKY